MYGRDHGVATTGPHGIIYRPMEIKSKCVHFLSNFDVCCFVPNLRTLLAYNLQALKCNGAQQIQIRDLERYSTVKTWDNSYEVVQCTFLASVDTAVDWVSLIGDTDFIWVWIISSILLLKVQLMIPHQKDRDEYSRTIEDSFGGLDLIWLLVVCCCLSIQMKIVF